MISRRLFLGGVTSTAAAPLLETLVRDLDLGVDGSLELRGDDILVVRIPHGAWSDEELAELEKILNENVWPNVLMIPEGVELDVLRR